MSYQQNVWNQLKNITVEKLMNALQKDGWEKEETSGAKIPYRKAMDNGEVRRVVIHYHPNKTYRSAKVLKGLLDDIGWSVEDMEGLKLIKQKGKNKKISNIPDPKGV